MKKVKFISIVVCLLAVLFLVNSANADLDLLGQGTSTHGTWNLIYDTDLDITWYDYTSSADVWQNQMDWATALSVDFGSNTYSDWRLPITFDQDCFNTYNCTNSEMGHLYYTELGNTARPDVIVPDIFWSGTEYSASTGVAWVFYNNTGLQTTYGKVNDYNGSNFYALAVMDGMAVVPEPISSTLFIVGGATFGFRRFWKKRRTA